LREQHDVAAAAPLDQQCLVAVADLIAGFRLRRSSL
jgi:hypothetical protein